MKMKGCKQVIMVAIAIVVVIFVYNSMKSGYHGLFGRMGDPPGPGQDKDEKKKLVVSCPDGKFPLVNDQEQAPSANSNQ